MSRFETPEECERTLVAVRELSAAIELEDVMRIVRRAVRALASADGATFVLREGEQVFYADEDAIAPLWKGRRFALDACVSGWAIAHRETVVIPDVDHDPRIPHEVYDATFVKSLAIVPIRTADPLGAIGAYWARSHTVSARVVDILQMLADAAGVSLERAALVSAERRARSDAERLRDAQGDLIRIVAHDIRNPLNAMMMSATLLQQVSNDTPLG